MIPDVIAWCGSWLDRLKDAASPHLLTTHEHSAFEGRVRCTPPAMMRHPATCAEQHASFATSPELARLRRARRPPRRKLLNQHPTQPKTHTLHSTRHLLLPHLVPLTPPVPPARRTLWGCCPARRCPRRYLVESLITSVVTEAAKHLATQDRRASAHRDRRMASAHSSNDEHLPRQPVAR